MNNIINGSMETPEFSFNGEYDAKCVAVYDGDTIQVVLSFRGILSRFHLRMVGYNSAELRTTDVAEKDAGIAAKHAMEALVLNKVIRVTINDKDKYGRLLGSVTVNGLDVNKKMISDGFGQEYFGSGEKRWRA